MKQLNKWLLAAVRLGDPRVTLIDSEPSRACAVPCDSAGAELGVQPFGHRSTRLGLRPGMLVEVLWLGTGEAFGGRGEHTGLTCLMGVLYRRDI